jgi:predicted nucleotidyltransferase
MAVKLMKQAIQAELDILRDIIINTVPVDQIHLFGSYAYGKPRKDSDLDLYVVLKDDAEIRNLDAGIQIRLAIRDRKSMPVDIVVSKHDDFLARKNEPTIERKIAREGILIYG